MKTDRRAYVPIQLTAEDNSLSLRASQGFWGNKGTCPFTFREQENKTGNTGTKAYFGNKGHQNRRNTFREHKGNLVGNKGTWTSPAGRPSNASDPRRLRGFYWGQWKSRRLFFFRCCDFRSPPKTYPRLP